MTDTPASTAPGAPAASAPPARTHRHGWWWKALLIGLLLWIVTVVVTVITRNVNLVPTVILLGSFLIPFVVALFAIERIVGVGPMHLLLAFAIGGICGVLGASLLEANLSSTPWVFVLVGLIEEFVKGVLVVVLGWRIVPKTARQGALFGATIGAGFAAFESAGYAFTAAITTRGIDVVGLVQTELLRAILSPVGHVLWTAILGAVIFGAARGGTRFRLTLAIPVAYLGVSFLHALWDSLGQISSFLALIFSGRALVILRYDGRLPAALAVHVQSLSTGLYFTGVVLASILGIGALVLVLVRGRRTATR